MIQTPKLGAVPLALTPGEAHDNRLAGKLLSRMTPGSMLLADRGYDADWIRELAIKKGAWANIPPKSNRSDPICFSPYLYRARNQVERFFNRIKQCRRVATRLPPIASPSSNSRQSGYGSALMSPRPSTRAPKNGRVRRGAAAASHQSSESGSNSYAINRNTGAFAAQISQKDRFGIGLLVGAFDTGGGGGSFSAGIISG